MQALAFPSEIWRTLITFIPSAIVAFNRFSISLEDRESSVSSISKYSPLLVTPTPRGAAKDMII